VGKDAPAQWQNAVGLAAGAALSPSPPETTARLTPCLQTGPLSDVLQGGEARELIREYYRLRRRARSLTGSAGAMAASAAVASSGSDDPRPVREALLRWYAARHDDVPQDPADAADTIFHKWGPSAHPGERSRYACSPHRLEPRSPEQQAAAAALARPRGHCPG
jgi:hypothetical protein